MAMQLEKPLPKMDINAVTKLMYDNQAVMKKFREKAGARVGSEKEQEKLREGTKKREKKQKKEKSQLRGQKGKARFQAGSKERWKAPKGASKDVVNKIKRNSATLNSTKTSADAKAKARAALRSLGAVKLDVSKTKLGKVKGKQRSSREKRSKDIKRRAKVIEGRKKQTFQKGKGGFLGRNKKLNEASQRAFSKLDADQKATLNKEVAALGRSQRKGKVNRYKKLRAIELAGGELIADSADFVGTMQTQINKQLTKVEQQEKKIKAKDKKTKEKKQREKIKSRQAGTKNSIKKKKKELSTATTIANSRYNTFKNAVSNTPLANVNNQDHIKKKNAMFSNVNSLKGELAVLENKLLLDDPAEVAKRKAETAAREEAEGIEFIKGQALKEETRIENIKFEKERNQRAGSLARSFKLSDIEKAEANLARQKLLVLKNKITGNINTKINQLRGGIKSDKTKLDKAIKRGDFEKAGEHAVDIKDAEDGIKDLENNKRNLKDRSSLEGVDEFGNKKFVPKTTKIGGAQRIASRRTTQRRSLGSDAASVGAKNKISVDLSNDNTKTQTGEAIMAGDIKQLTQNEYNIMKEHARRKNNLPLLDTLRSKKKIIIKTRKAFDGISEHKAMLTDKFASMKSLLPQESQQNMDLDYVKKMMDDSKEILKK